MDFKKVVGKKLVWSGEFTEEGEYVRTYLLFEDESCLRIADPEEGEEAVWLDNPKDVLSETVREGLSKAASLLELGQILQLPEVAEAIAGLLSGVKKEGGHTEKQDDPTEKQDELK